MNHLRHCAVSAALLVAACSTVPLRDAQLESARSMVSGVAANPRVVALAPKELLDAQQSLVRADAAWRDGYDPTDVHHWSYLAQQRAAIALATADQRADEAAVANASAERDRIKLAVRTQQADVARQVAEQARREANLTRLQAEQAQRDAAAAGAAAATLRQQSEQATVALARAQDDASQERARAARLERELSDLQAQQTARGVVVTMGDVLFDTGRAELKPGGMRIVDKLAAFMRDNPDRRFDIEGFTDSVGDAGYNQQLSERRASAVQLALIDRGIDPARISSRGYGKDYPIASNDNVAGRQLNRRVEIVISGPNGVKVGRR